VFCEFLLKITLHKFGGLGNYPHFCIRFKAEGTVAEGDWRSWIGLFEIYVAVNCLALLSGLKLQKKLSERFGEVGKDSHFCIRFRAEGNVAIRCRDSQQIEIQRDRIGFGVVGQP